MNFQVKTMMMKPCYLNRMFIRFESKVLENRNVSEKLCQPPVQYLAQNSSQQQAYRRERKKKRILFPIRFMFFTKHSQNTTTVARISIRNTKLLMLDEELNAAKNITHAWLESLYGGTAYDHTIQRLFMEVVKLGEGSKEKCAKNAERIE